MTVAHSGSRWLWMSLGLAAGLAIAFMWPHEYAAASVSDRNEKFAMVTARFDSTDLVEGVFILDFLTGQLRGSVINPATGRFSVLYARDVAADFNLDPNRSGTYAIVSGRTSVNATVGTRPAASCIYIAELTSGKVLAYSFPAATGAALPLVPLDGFQFREPAQ